ncbi:MAG: ATP-binding protein [bacterium]|nr:ATP-binding protein [bacterium]
MAVKTTIGQPARMDSYFKRPKLTGKLWAKVKGGANVLMTAPRRVGKSSIMFHFLDFPPEHFKLIYMDTESVNNENEFYKKLYKHVIDTLSKVGRYKKIIADFAKVFPSRIESIGLKGISVGDGGLNYTEEFLKLVTSLGLEEDRLVIMLDEFAETVQNIVKDEGRNQAVRFLQGNRTLRLMPELKDKVQFILAGSIGLENVVDALDASGTINDLYSFPVPPLNQTEAKALIKKIIAGSGYVFKEKHMTYMLDKLEWLIPFYIQLIVDEIDKLEFPADSMEITKKEIDLAFSNAVDHRNYFSNWHTRLRRSYTGAEYSFTKELLNYISEKDTADSTLVHDLAVKHNIETNAGNILNALKYDGYIHNSADPKVYRFNSPLLKLWWYKNVAY